MGCLFLHSSKEFIIDTVKGNKFFGDDSMASVFTAQHIFSIIFILAAYFQFRSANNYKKTIMKHGTDQPVAFGGMMLWNNYIVAIVLFLFAIMLLIGPLSQ